MDLVVVKISPNYDSTKLASYSVQTGNYFEPFAYLNDKSYHEHYFGMISNLFKHG